MTPAHAVGLVNVEVKPILGILFDYVGTNAYEYKTGTFVNSGPVTVNPNHGSTAGGTVVTITIPSMLGLVGLSLLPTVTFGGTAATACDPIAAQLGSPTVSFNCTTGAHAAGLVDVTVTSTLGLVNVTGTGAYTYDAGGGPAGGNVTVNPNKGPTTGGQTVSITIPALLGLGLGLLPSVTFDGIAATGCSLITAIPLSTNASFTCVTPAHALGFVNVDVTNGVLFHYTGTNAYEYAAGPFINSGLILSPNHGPTSGGTAVTVTIPATGLVGSLIGLSLLPSASFGGAAATCTPVSVALLSTTVSFVCTTSAHAAGLVDVTVTDTLGLINVTAPSAYLYEGGGPATGGNVKVVPGQGPIEGGTPVTITIPAILGVGAVPSATFDGLPATACSVLTLDLGGNTASFGCKTPAHAAGFVNVEVKNALLFDYTGVNAYQYTTGPIITTGPLTVSPNHGPTAGGTVVTITIPSAAGLVGLLLTPTAKFDGLAATGCSTISASVGSPTVSFTCSTPAHAAGPVTVVVTDATNLINVTAPNAYTYDPPGGPVGPATGGQVGVVPNQGPTAGNQLVTITIPSVAGLVGITLTPTVTFAGNAATACTPIAATVASGNVSFTCRTPAHAAGFVNVEVKDAAGTIFDYVGINVYEYTDGNGGGGGGGGGGGPPPSVSGLVFFPLAKPDPRPRYPR